MQFKFETKRHGRCMAETEGQVGYAEVTIWYDERSDPKRVTYYLHIKDEPLPRQIPDGGALQDATRIAINHFEAVKSKDGDEHEFRCGRITARWPGKLYNKMS